MPAIITTHIANATLKREPQQGARSCPATAPVAARGVGPDHLQPGERGQRGERGDDQEAVAAEDAFERGGRGGAGAGHGGRREFNPGAAARRLAAAVDPAATSPSDSYVLDLLGPAQHLRTGSRIVFLHLRYRRPL